ncbi:MAG: DNA-processing protein DprA [Bacillota bacterium]
MSRAFWIGWALAVPAGGRKIIGLLERFGSLREAWLAPEGDERLRGVEAGVARRRQIDPERELERLSRKGIRFVTWEDSDYPGRLRHIFDPPAVIFYKGRLAPEDDLAVAVVGSRRCTYYGRAVAGDLGEGLARAGVTVVSGMARGIDSAAHRGALKGGGRTIAVLGTGLDVVYPRENTKLMHEIAENGAVLSEFGLGVQPEPWHFPVRNRIIAGISCGVVVVEAAERSGALITADLALESNRDVMAVPGPVTSPTSRGANKLIKQGARLVEDVEDILDELGLLQLFPGDVEALAAVSLSPGEEQVLGILREQGGPVGEDELITRSAQPPAQVTAALAYLEIKGLVTRLPGRLYCISHCKR